MHIGLIGGIGPAATDFYYRGLINAMRKAGRDLQLTMAHADAPTLIQNLENGRDDAQAQIYLELSERLVRAGAERLVITSIGGHFCIDAFRRISPIPIIELISSVDHYLRSHKFAKVGLLGTDTVMRSRFYGGLGSVDVAIPPAAEAEAVHGAYVSMAMEAKVTQAKRDIMFDAGRKLSAQGAETILLGGTDLFLAFDGASPGFPVTDCAQVHIDAIAALACS
ncbi:MAG: aspartate/glutamate racemase family protein [Rhizobiaceae bacterium]